MLLAVSGQQPPPGTGGRNCKEQSSSVDWPLSTVFIKDIGKAPWKKRQSIIITWGSACEKQHIGRDQVPGSIALLAKEAQGNVEIHKKFPKGIFRQKL